MLKSKLSSRLSLRRPCELDAATKEKMCYIDDDVKEEKEELIEYSVTLRKGSNFNQEISQFHLHLPYPHSSATSEICYSFSKFSNWIHSSRSSFTIICQLWHVSDNIFKYLDAVSLLNCEKVQKILVHYTKKVLKSSAF